MFGYVRPYKPLMRVCDYEIYEAVYCGICGTIRRRYGLGAALALSYDLTFLAALHIALNGSELISEKHRCPVHPLKGRLCVCRKDSRDKELEYAADCHVILSFSKLTDDLFDGSILKKLRAAALLPSAYILFYRKAKKHRPGLARAVRNAMKEQRRTERSGTRSIDRLSEPTASMMRALFCELGDCDPDKRTELGRLGYMLGRFIYICDALDDIAEDAKNGDVNPFLPRSFKRDCGKVPDEQIYIRAVRNARAAVELTLGELSAIYELLPLTAVKPVTDNIVEPGLRHNFNRIAEKTLSEKVFHKL